MYTQILTDPNKNNSNRFVYLVNAFGVGLLDQQKPLSTLVEERLHKISTPNQYYSCSLIARLDSKVAKKILGYNGNIERVFTLGNIGLILRPATDEIIKATSPNDMGTPFSQQQLRDYIVNLGEDHHTPLEMLTEVGAHNHLVLEGNNKTEIQAVFFKYYVPKTKSYMRKQAEELTHLLAENTGKDIPIVRIDEIRRKG